MRHRETSENLGVSESPWPITMCFAGRRPFATACEERRPAIPARRSVAGGDSDPDVTIGIATNHQAGTLCEPTAAEVIDDAAIARANQRRLTRSSIKVAFSLHTHILGRISLCGIGVSEGVAGRRRSDTRRAKAECTRVAGPRAVKVKARVNGKPPRAEGGARIFQARVNGKPLRADRG